MKRLTVILLVIIIATISSGCIGPHNDHDSNPKSSLDSDLNNESASTDEKPSKNNTEREDANPDFEETDSDDERGKAYPLDVGSLNESLREKVFYKNKELSDKYSDLERMRNGLLVSVPVTDLPPDYEVSELNEDSRPPESISELFEAGKDRNLIARGVTGRNLTEVKSWLSKFEEEGEGYFFRINGQVVWIDWYAISDPNGTVAAYLLDGEYNFTLFYEPGEAVDFESSKASESEIIQRAINKSFKEGDGPYAKMGSGLVEVQGDRLTELAELFDELETKTFRVNGSKVMVRLIYEE